MHIDITARRLQLLAAGYSIIPNKAKIPAVAGWNDPSWVEREMTPDRVSEWPLRFPGADSTGVILRDGLGCLDIDVDDELVHRLLVEIDRIAPGVYAFAPTRFGSSQYKMALFFKVEGESWSRLASRKYNGHCVEIFGGQYLKGGKASRQFGIDGPHSYDKAGNVIAYYEWHQDMPDLAQAPIRALPTLSQAEALEILSAFEWLAQEAGWAPDTAQDAGPGEVVYDIDLTTRFDTNRGGTQIDYEELCDEYALHGDGLRCSANFMPGRGDSGSRDRCLIGDSNRHKCVAVWVPGDETIHFPARLAKPGHSLDEEQPKVPAKGITVDDFYAYSPHHNYIFAPNGRIWVLAGVNASLDYIPLLNADGTPQLDKKLQPKFQKPSTWLDQNRAVGEMTWAPGEPQLIRDRIPSEGGWVEKEGAAVFNQYNPPRRQPGNPINAGRWVELVHRVYPDHAEHIITFCAHRIQKPAEKINHALVLAGAPGIGKDTLLEPLCRGVGEWNFKDVSPRHLMDRNNDYVRAVVLRVSELRDLGEFNRYELYEVMKILAAAPPHMLRVNTKYVAEYYVANVAAVIGTTNYATDGLYLPPDDRRHYVCGTDTTQKDFRDGYFSDIWQWYRAGGGINDVIAYLAEYDISAFDAQKPPLKTAAFLRMVDGGAAAELPELRDAIDRLGVDGNPPAALTKDQVMRKAPELRDWIKESKNARNFARRMDDCGYLVVRCANRDDGLWRIDGKRLMIYASRALEAPERYKAAETLQAAEDKRIKAQKGSVIPFKT